MLTAYARSKGSVQSLVRGYGPLGMKVRLTVSYARDTLYCANGEVLILPPVHFPIVTLRRVSLNWRERRPVLSVVARCSERVVTMLLAPRTRIVHPGGTVIKVHQCAVIVAGHGLSF
jgi:hypothetical protein